ncbi:MAG: alpha/beta hydrolase [Halobacteriales archaeon]|nr:alpha/beta hydrolase [Halobacteriales archaeon]
MPTATNQGVTLYYESDGDGNGEPVVFIEDVGYGAWLWGWQAPTLSSRYGYRTIVWDNRGTGRSDAPEGPYTIETMAADLEAVLSTVGVRSAHLVGAGMGGMIALAYAHEYGRADSLTVLGTAASGEDVAVRAQLGDPRESLEAVTSEEFRAGHPEAIDRIVSWRRADDASPAATEAQATAVENFDITDHLYEITEPAIVLHGTADAVVPLDAGRRLAEGLPRGTIETFENGSHFVFIEQARLVTDAIADFLGSVEP